MAIANLALRAIGANDGQISLHECDFAMTLTASRDWARACLNLELDVGIGFRFMRRTSTGSKHHDGERADTSSVRHRLWLLTTASGAPGEDRKWHPSIVGLGAPHRTRHALDFRHGAMIAPNCMRVFAIQRDKGEVVSGGGAGG